MNQPKSVPFALAANKPRTLLRKLRILLVICASLGTIVALFYAEENWRGQRAWLAYKQRFEAGGRTFDLRSIIPPPVPDDQNFAMTRLLKPLYEFELGSQKWKDSQTFNSSRPLMRLLEELPRANLIALKSVVSADRRRKMNGDWHLGRSRDIIAVYLVNTLDTNNTVRSAPDFDPAKVSVEQAARGILENFRMVDPILAEISLASARPYSRFPINYEPIFPGPVLLPHLGSVSQLGRWASFKASAELAAGQSNAAMNDVLITLRLAESIRDERILVSQLIRANLVNLAIQPIWEGLAAHRWSDVQLAKLQNSLLSIDLISHFRQAIEGERLMGNAMIELMSKSTKRVFILNNMRFRSSYEEDVTSLLGLFDLLPKGWFYLERLEYNRMFDLLDWPKSKPEQGRIDPQVSRKKIQFEAEFSHTQGFAPVRNHRVLARIMLPGLFHESQLRAASVQAAIEQAAIACALERYRIEKAEYPRTLDALVPAFTTNLPPDVVTGEAYKYRRNVNGSFVLYSVGWDIKDNQGTMAYLSPGNEYFDPEKGDWVWFSTERANP